MYAMPSYVCCGVFQTVILLITCAPAIVTVAARSRYGKVIVGFLGLVFCPYVRYEYSTMIMRYF